MTAPDDKRPTDDAPEGSIETGALAAASEEDDAASDPLAPLNAVTENDDDSKQ